MTTNSVNESVSLEDLGVQDKPDGPVAAAIIAGGIGALALGLFTILSEASAGFKALATLTSSVGTLSGKAVFTVIVWLAAWAGLHFALRNKSFDLTKALMIALVLIAVGVVATIPPIFVMFAPAE
ncbi:hypothetical protein [Propionicimonas sp.]|uniref:hypothetical protein n=1 Tax=Propionicimonas sp. TaxID=1955623 RepID=UPI0017945441|nr:hypothetical protein [Propionicimonas sp.]MBU3975920.1 hypothetical protein [Actinomycetota bacterium]MBA3020736.1 hypothetical protein [Propionicimonas sp.]MBU3985110.1 hypothetical protein [Actinomycetota bacterium]MBU4008100.1 hypothetical protein [Actinomycetota bacterium]MBU4064686.1 hypothetical protein [Actinomycetota bacterium]